MVGKRNARRNRGVYRGVALVDRVQSGRAPFPGSLPMARYKYIDTSPRFIPIDLARQLLPGTFEHAVNHLLEHELDLTRFDARFRNDVTGAPA